MIARGEITLRPVDWVGSSLADLKRFPRAVVQEIGVALMYAQAGEKAPNAKPLRHIGAGVLEILESHQKNAYRAVYTVRFSERIYVLHCFQKKSKTGIATPKADLDLIKSRLKLAEQDDAERRRK